jgi:hypothetical protein
MLHGDQIGGRMHLAGPEHFGDSVVFPHISPFRWLLKEIIYHRPSSSSNVDKY